MWYRLVKERESIHIPWWTIFATAWYAEVILVILPIMTTDVQSEFPTGFIADIKLTLESVFNADTITPPLPMTLPTR